MSNKKMSQDRHSKTVGISMTPDEFNWVQGLMKHAGIKRYSRFVMVSLKRLYNREAMGKDWATKQILYLTRQKARIERMRTELDEEEADIDEQLEILRSAYNEEDGRIQSEGEDD